MIWISLYMVLLSFFTVYACCSSTKRVAACPSRFPPLIVLRTAAALLTSPTSNASGHLHSPSKMRVLISALSCAISWTRGWFCLWAQASLAVTLSILIREAIWRESSLASTRLSCPSHWVVFMSKISGRLCERSASKVEVLLNLKVWPETVFNTFKTSARIFGGVVCKIVLTNFSLTTSLKRSCKHPTASALLLTSRSDSSFAVKS
mmetsp:Transcript_35667/g.87756  ORF Transcript_35667/g.87756 Transcript_35667/m.87756 type:complete len:206 (-) Transcript_35667:668-1285(-)